MNLSFNERLKLYFEKQVLQDIDLIYFLNDFRLVRLTYSSILKESLK